MDNDQSLKYARLIQERPTRHIPPSPPVKPYIPSQLDFKNSHILCLFRGEIPKGRGKKKKENPNLRIMDGCGLVLHEYRFLYVIFPFDYPHFPGRILDSKKVPERRTG